MLTNIIVLGEVAKIDIKILGTGYPRPAPGPLHRGEWKREPLKALPEPYRMY